MQPIPQFHQSQLTAASLFAAFKGSLGRLLCAAVVSVVVLVTPVDVRAVALDPLFSPGMVLQRGRAITLTGTGDEGELIKVSLGGKSAEIRSKGGRWSITLGPFPPGGPHEIRVAGHREIVVPDVWFGDVWLCSGQSNMAMRVRGTDTSVHTLPPDDFRGVHLLSVPKEMSDTPRAQIDARWSVASKAEVSRFSAVCFFFGSALAKRLQVPVGLIDASAGGSRIEAWISESTLKTSPDYAAIREFFNTRAARSVPKTDTGRPALKMPSTLYNGMIAPLEALPVKGILWYQGEANARQDRPYLGLLQSLAEDWRSRWKDPELPFVYVQISSLGELKNEVGRSTWAHLREEQLRAESLIKNSAMVVSYDLGDGSLHPRRKRPVGERAAAAALAIAYGERLDFRGPRLAEATFHAHEGILKFDVFQGCLASGGEEPRGFFLAGENRIWHPAKATLSGDRVTLTSLDVARPVAARYAWGNSPVGTLTSCTGLPASPFRTDNWPE